MVDLGEHCEQAAAIVATWPAWKRNVLGFWSNARKVMQMNACQWRNGGRQEPIGFEIVNMADYPPGEGGDAWCEWLRHIDGREVLLLRGQISHNASQGMYWHDFLAKAAFGPEACHACVAKWADGKIVDGEYRPHYITTDKEPKLCEAGRPCSACRERIAKEIMDKAVKEVESKTGRRVVWAAEEDAKPVSKIASMADVTIAH